jgi:glycosyltransferase involved in cell wall biosynthesis
MFKDVLRIIPDPVPPPDMVRIAREKPSKDLVAIGRLTEEKCFDSLIAAFSRVADRHPNWNLTVYGDGRLRSDLEMLVESLGLNGRVSLPGTVKNSTSVLASCDLFVLSSRFEGFPNALCEAMSVGLPVISTNCPGGARDLVRDGIDGLLVPVRDVSAMASALDRLMSDSSERDRLGVRAREISKRFDLHEVMKMWNEALVTSRG